jgi:esterase
MQLHATVSGEGAPVVILHGLFGMGSNLGGLARSLAAQHRVHQLDLPNHGRSAWDPVMNLQSLAAAIGGYIDDNCDAAPTVVGHSLGGKVAMQIALSQPGRLEGMVVADIAPVRYSPSHDGVFAAIDAVATAAPETRSQAAKLMRRFLKEEGVVQFMLLSLRREPAGHYVWRFNHRALRENYARLLAAPVGQPFSGPALFVYGSESSYMDDAGISAAKSLFPAARFAAIAGTGHWLHAEKPEEFNGLVREFLLRAPLTSVNDSTLSS